MGGISQTLYIILALGTIAWNFKSSNGLMDY